MKTQNVALTRPNLKTKGFSTLHIQIFMMILVGKTNREINSIFGYTQRSHAVVDHSRKVMFKLLAMENLPKRENLEQVVYPRNYQFWWKKIFDKHHKDLLAIAISPEFYD
ncbi:hypothetical protein [Mucilaginibacter pedocola]|uniref:Uncharacterized protein n=1 Tax=Mucilaginibacter pedocola TaxID=1792845 RepID=A0A1S9PIR7_9SPHI|nr:hypothetical protein [Mucilaginibacter pedocola]OOQ60842.1 hypothetical protein BC343_23020 [Mucilaginibacter pedocola]